MDCQICGAKACRDLEICSECNLERLEAANLDLNGKRVDLINSIKFSIPNWIKFKKYIDESYRIDLGG